MSKLHHPNIVQFLGYIDKPFVLIMEYIPNGNLLEKIKTLKRKQKISIMQNILQALVYLHNRRPQSLIHRDIKPTNILLTKSNVAKITDFGISKLYMTRKNSLMVPKITTKIMNRTLLLTLVRKGIELQKLIVVYMITKSIFIRVAFFCMKCLKEKDTFQIHQCTGIGVQRKFEILLKITCYVKTLVKDWMLCQYLSLFIPNP